MKKIFTILSVLVLTLSCIQANAQNDKKDNDYNLQRAWEALREEKDDAKALASQKAQYLTQMITSVMQDYDNVKDNRERFF